MHQTALCSVVWGWLGTLLHWLASDVSQKNPTPANTHPPIPYEPLWFSCHRHTVSGAQFAHQTGSHPWGVCMSGVGLWELRGFVCTEIRPDHLKILELGPDSKWLIYFIRAGFIYREFTLVKKFIFTTKIELRLHAWNDSLCLKFCISVEGFTWGHAARLRPSRWRTAWINRHDFCISLLSTSLSSIQPFPYIRF